MKIVCGTDFSDRATRVATAAATLSIRSGDTLVLVHVLEINVLESNETLQALEKAVRSRLHWEVERLRKMGATVEELFLTGSPYELLVETARKPDVRLVIVGATGRKAPERWLLGSVAERTAEKSPVPTLVVRDPAVLEKWVSARKPLNVFVATDFSSNSDAALFWVKQLQQIAKCHVTVGHVDWPPESSLRLGTTGPISFSEDPEERRILERDLKEKSERILGSRPVRIRLEPGWGRVDAHLVLLAESEKADLIVVGTRQHEGLARLWFGSVSRGVLHDAPMNVAVVPMLKESAAIVPEIRRVLVTTDFSKLANAAIPHAYAPVISGGTVHLAHITRPNRLQKHLVAKEIPTNYFEPIRKKLRALVLKNPPRGIKTEIEVIAGADVAQAICRTAERIGADLICMGSHGRSGISKALLGSVAEAVMNNSRRPVLIIRPTES